MTNQEMVDKIAEKSGITREQAVQALEMHSWDLLDAMIYVEQTYKNKTENYASFSDTPKGTEGNSQNFHFNEQKHDAENGRQFGQNLKKIIDFLVSDGITIYHNEKEVAAIPLIVWVVLLCSSVSTLVLVMFVTMFCNVRYSFSGKLGGSKVNKLLFEIYMFVQTIKGKMFG